MESGEGWVLGCVCVCVFFFAKGVVLEVGVFVFWCFCLLVFVWVVFGPLGWVGVIWGWVGLCLMFFERRLWFVDEGGEPDFQAIKETSTVEMPYKLN